MVLRNLSRWREQSYESKTVPTPLEGGYNLLESLIFFLVPASSSTRNFRCYLKDVDRNITPYQYIPHHINITVGPGKCLQIIPWSHCLNQQH